MINPYSYGEAVSGLKFMVAPISFPTAIGGREGDRQLTMVEISTNRATTDDFEISFHSPSLLCEIRQDVLLSDSTPVSSMMVGWNRQDSLYGPRTKLVGTARIEGKTTDIDPIFPNFIIVKIPACPNPAGQVVTAAWTHDILKNQNEELTIFVPIQNDSMRCCCSEIITMGCDPSPYADAPAENPGRFIRWDLFAACGITLKPAVMERASLVIQSSGALPFHNLWFPLEKRSPNNRMYVSTSGALLRDDTRLRLATFFDVGFQALISICGCIVRDGVRFPTAHVPLMIMEGMTRAHGPLIIRESLETPTVTLQLGDQMLRVNPTEREYFGGVFWITAKI